MTTIDARIHAVSRAQLGRISRRQLRQLGVGPATIRRRRRAGAWSEPIPNVIDLGTHEVTWRARVTEVLLAAGERSWASHRTAAHLHGFLDVPRPARIDVLVPRGRHGQVGEHRLHRARSVADDEVTVTRGLRATTRSRTLIDLAATTGPDDLERWLLDLARRDGTVVASVVALLDRHRALPGRRRLFDAVQRLPGDTAELGSPLEVLGVQLLTRLGAPPFVLQHTVRDVDGAPVKRVDVAWPQMRVVVEFDGAAWHDGTAARAADDEVRGRMRALGWRVLTVRRQDLHGPALRELVASLR